MMEEFEEYDMLNIGVILKTDILHIPFPGPPYILVYMVVSLKVNTTHPVRK